jgi:hypothetical protein
MVKYYCDRCGKESKGLTPVKIPIEKLKYSVGTKLLDLCSECEKEAFVSVLGYMTDAGDFPAVRECYVVGNTFFFPALLDIHPVSHWMPLPKPPKGENNVNR